MVFTNAIMVFTNNMTNCESQGHRRGVQVRIKVVVAVEVVVGQW
jgi:hypothetical protein